MSILFRAGPSENFSKVVLAGVRPAGVSYVPGEVKEKVQPLTNYVQYPRTAQSMRFDIRKGGIFTPGIKFCKGIFSSAQVRFGHTDIKFPDFDNYRRKSTKDPTVPTRENEDKRRVATYWIYTVGGIMSLYAAKTVVHAMVGYKSPARDKLAMAAIEIDVKDIPEGASQSFMWRGKPVFVKHRTAMEVEKERAVPVTELRDPETDEQRVKKPEWLVAVGVCTHLGCIPIAGMGEYGGYYCPCHGSHYDGSGRIRKGPAPLNLEVPEYYFKDDTTIVVGSTG